MNVLFKNIPIGIKDFELAKFIESNFNAGRMGKDKLPFKVGGIEMMERQDSFSHPVKQFGIVRICPSETARKVIKQLDGFVFNKLKMSVREYFSRSLSNDPRLKNIEFPKVFIEKRINDRRVHTLIYSRQV